MKFKYPLLFEDRSILINSYNIETILSTVLRRGKYNSRWKMAIGLQQVDNLTPSEYLKELVKLNIKNEISFDELESKLKKYMMI